MTGPSHPSESYYWSLGEDTPTRGSSGPPWWSAVEGSGAASWAAGVTLSGQIVLLVRHAG